jgi:hypothetical protein
MTLDADSNSAGIGDRDQPLQVFYLLIEGCSVLSAGQREGDDFGGFGQVANFFKSLVEGFSLGVDLDVITADIHAMGIADQAKRLVEILDDLGWLDLLPAIVEDDFHGSELEIVEDIDHVWDRNIGKTTC